MPKTSTDCLHLAPSDINKLLQLLEEDKVSDKRLGSLLKYIRSAGFEARDNFKIGLFLASLLQQPSLFPGACQRISAFFIIYELYKKGPLADNPFSLVFNHFLQLPVNDDESMGDAPKASKNNLGSSQEQRFLATLVCCQCNDDLANKTPQKVLNPKKKQQSDIDISNFQLAIVQEHSQRFLSSKSNISNILTIPSFSGYVSSSQQCRSIACELFARGDGLQVESAWKPEFIRPIPPLMPCGRNELVWMNPRSEDHHFLWDDSINKIVNNEIQLTQSEIARLVAMRKDKSLLFFFRKSEKTDLSSDCDNFSTGALLERAILSRREDLYLPVLIVLNYGLHSFRVISDFIVKYSLPHQFSDLYIFLCISKLYDYSESSRKDALIHSMASLLMKMINKKMVICSILTEILSFCYNFHRHRSVMRLFRTLKANYSAQKYDVSN